MEQPIFYQGQKVRAIDPTKNGEKGTPTPIIEGKAYYVSNPDYIRKHGVVYICLSGIDRAAFDQDDFVSDDDNNKLEAEIFESLKGAKIFELITN